MKQIIRKEILFTKELFDRIKKAVEQGKAQDTMKFIRSACVEKLEKLGIN